MTNLTEQWHKGELIDGKKYYITFMDSEPFEATFRAAEAIIPFWKFEAQGRQYCDEKGCDCVKVLAPVPTFEEWQDKLRALDAAHKTIKMEDETINRLVRSGKQCNYENAQLKELLKECREEIDPYIEVVGGKKTFKNLIDKINEVIQ